MLAFGRKQLSEPRLVHLNDIVRTIDRLLTHVLREDIECKLFLTDEELTVYADPGQIDQILLNLASNARDAMPNGGELSINTTAMILDTDFITRHGFGAPGRYAVISVTDNGTGMDESTRQRIFDPFFTTKEVGKGTGLGLAIIYGIVKQHNGYITCLSEPGTGTTFTIYLPLYQSKIESNVLKIATPSPTGGTETILLAEDDEMVRNLNRTILEEAGYCVIEAVNGANAVQKFMDHRKEVKLLLMDLIMPRMNGRDAYNEIRSVNPRIPVIFTSGYSTDIINRQELTADGLPFLAKPVTPVEMLRKVREVLDQPLPLT
jgi:CheY-like chemotaxis protein